VIKALRPLTELPGVQLVMFVSEDGVPIAVPGQGGPHALDPIEDDGRGLGREDAIAAVATGWLREIQQGVAQASWHEPQRIVLRGARGTLVMQRARGAVLLLLLSRGLAHEDVRLPMDATAARLDRNRGKETRDQAGAHPSTLAETPGPIPSVDESLRTKRSLDVGSNRDSS